MAEADSVAIENLFARGAHFAQVRSRRHPSMKPYLVGSTGAGRQEIIDLAQTAEQLAAARAAMATLAREGKTVLFVGGKTEAAEAVARVARRLGTPFVAGRWLGGTISNWPEIKKRIDRLSTLAEERTSGAAAKSHTKLELVLLEREEKRLVERLSGLAGLVKRPDALVIVDSKREHHAAKEARDASIPIIAIMSSDCNAAEVTYPIVANDASRDAIAYLLDELGAAFEEGRLG